MRTAVARARDSATARQAAILILLGLITLVAAAILAAPAPSNMASILAPNPIVLRARGFLFPGAMAEIGAGPSAHRSSIS